MATTKTLTPTNQAITLAAFTEKPDNRTNVTNDDKLADAVNALNSNINIINDRITIPDASLGSGSFVTLATISVGNPGTYLIMADAAFPAGDGIRILMVETSESNLNNPANSVIATGRASLQKIRLFTLTPSDRIYIRAYQNSNATQTVGGVYQILRLK